MSGPPIGSGDRPLSDLARIVVGTFLKSEVRRRMNALEKEPLGYIIKAGIARHLAIQEQDREWTHDDLGAFLGDVPAAVERARQDKQRGDGGDF